MDWWFLGIVLIVGYLALQNFGHHVRWKGAVKAFAALSEMLGTIAEMPKDEIDKAVNIWGETRITAERNIAIGSIVLLVIAIFLVALGIHGKI
jgi:hypothetical protein